mgnify:CR=1 FL=1
MEIEHKTLGFKPGSIPHELSATIVNSTIYFNIDNHSPPPKKKIIKNLHRDLTVQRYIIRLWHLYTKSFEINFTKIYYVKKNLTLKFRWVIGKKSKLYKLFFSFFCQIIPPTTLTRLNKNMRTNNYYNPSFICIFKKNKL